MEMTLKEGNTQLVITAKNMVFKSGNTGLGYYGKLPIEGKEYQVTINFVEKKAKETPVVLTMQERIEALSEL